MEEIAEKANRLCNEIHSELVQRGLKFKQVGIMVVMEDISIRSRMRTLDSPTNDLEALKSNVRELFKRFLEESELEIRRVGVKVSGFIKEDYQKRLRSFIE